MKFRLVAVLILGVSCCFANAESVTNVTPYVRVSGGGALLNDSDLSYSGDEFAEAEFDPGYVLGVAVGIDMGVTDANGTLPVRVEAEFGYQENDLDTLKDTLGLGLSTDDGKLTMMTLMLNGYIDFKNKSNVTPYLMAGVGAANVDAELEGESDDELVFAGQVGVGLAFAVSENVSIDTEYRYFLTENPKFNVGGYEIDAEVSGHRLQLGVRYTFN